MPFADFIGHERPTRSLQAAIRNGRMAHAYLFDGPEGVGKRRFALALAKALHCGELGPTDYCDTCRSCLRIEHGNHGNVWTYAPDPKRKEFTIDRIEQLREELAMRASEPGMRVFVLDSAERMNDVVQNRLLKTLEEPRDDVVLILVVTHPERLMPTIRSRAQRVRFSPLPTDVVRDRLLARGDVDETLALEIARLSGGSLGKALALAEDDTLKTGHLWVEGFLTIEDRHVGETAGALIETVGAAASKRAEGRRRLRELLGLVLDFWRDVLVTQISPESEVMLVTFEEQSGLCAQRLDERVVMDVLQAVSHTREDLEANAQGPVAITDLLIKCRRLLAGKPAPRTPQRIFA